MPKPLPSVGASSDSDHEMHYDVKITISSQKRVRLRRVENKSIKCIQRHNIT
jgi:hypothetical protein